MFLFMSQKYYHIIDESHSYLVRRDSVKPDEVFPVHTQADWELFHIAEGSGRVIIGNDSFPFSGGEVYLVPPDMRHGWKFDGGLPASMQRIESISVFMRKALFDALPGIMPEMRQLGRLEKRRSAFLLCGKTSGKVRKLMSEAAAADEPERFVFIMRMLRQLALSDELNVTGYNKPQRKADERMQRINAYLPLHYNRDISIDAVASFVHMNRSSFCVFFKRMTGMSFVSYVNAYRVDTACRLLAGTDKPVSEVAYSVGFNSSAHFCRIFREIKKCTPTAYRALVGRNAVGRYCL